MKSIVIHGPRLELGTLKWSVSGRIATLVRTGNVYSLAKIR